MFICLKIKYTLSQEHVVFMKSFSFQIENRLASALTNFFFFMNSSVLYITAATLPSEVFSFLMTTEI